MAFKNIIGWSNIKLLSETKIWTIANQETFIHLTVDSLHMVDEK